MSSRVRRRASCTLWLISAGRLARTQARISSRNACSSGVKARSIVCLLGGPSGPGLRVNRVSHDRSFFACRGGDKPPAGLITLPPHASAPSPSDRHPHLGQRLEHGRPGRGVGAGPLGRALWRGRGGGAEQPARRRRPGLGPTRARAPRWSTTNGTPTAGLRRRAHGRHRRPRPRWCCWRASCILTPGFVRHYEGGLVSTPACCRPSLA